MRTNQVISVFLALWLIGGIIFQDWLAGGDYKVPLWFKPYYPGGASCNWTLPLKSIPLVFYYPSKKVLGIFDCLGIWIQREKVEDHFIDFRKREIDFKGGRAERETSMWERNIDCQPYMPQPVIEPDTFWCTGQSSTQLSHSGQGHFIDFFLTKYF